MDLSYQQQSSHAFIAVGDKSAASFKALIEPHRAYLFNPITYWHVKLNYPSTALSVSVMYFIHQFEQLEEVFGSRGYTGTSVSKWSYENIEQIRVWIKYTCMYTWQQAMQLWHVTLSPFVAVIIFAVFLWLIMLWCIAVSPERPCQKLLMNSRWKNFSHPFL